MIRRLRTFILITGTVLAGLILGIYFWLTVQEWDLMARGGPLPVRSLLGRMPVLAFGTAFVSLFFSWLGLIGLHRVTDMCGRELWLPLGLSALTAVVATLILVAVEFRAFPLATWKVLGIGLPFMATGGFLAAASIGKHRW